MDRIVITRPDDWHAHLRDGPALATTVPAAARYFSRTIVMPNLAPPVVNVDLAKAYRERIITHRPPDSSWEPLMTIYLTDRTNAQELSKAKESGFIVAAKYYPAGATTHSDAGVTDLHRIYPLLETMEKIGMPLLLHGEVTDDHIDIFDREAVFIDRYLRNITATFPRLKVILEHITTLEGAQFVADASAQVAATITPQHLLFNRNAMLVGGIKPHFYCLPILKRDHHQRALIQAAISGSPKFFLGTDSAPHSQASKESACGCAGCFSHHAAIELYTQVFEQENALERLEGFASFYGADFYGLPRNRDHITLARRPWETPSSIPMGDEALIPLSAGATLNWQVLAHD